MSLSSCAYSTICDAFIPSKHNTCITGKSLFDVIIFVLTLVFMSLAAFAMLVFTLVSLVTQLFENRLTVIQD